jgi:predicted ATPase
MNGNSGHALLEGSSRRHTLSALKGSDIRAAVTNGGSTRRRREGSPGRLDAFPTNKKSGTKTVRMNECREENLGRLDFAAKRPLCGREDELNRLKALFERICKPREEAAASIEVCLVHGLSGVGKSSLCAELQKHVPLFLKGKYDQYVDYQQPYSSIVQAFDGLGESLERNDSVGDLEDLRKALSLEGKVLGQLVPSFARIMNVEHTPASGNLNMAAERLAVALQAFVRSFCSPSRPMVLFLDDVQWADPNSQQLISMVTNDPEMKHLLLLVGYREEESDAMESFLSSLPSSVRDLPVQNLDVAALNAMVAEILSCDLEKCAELAELIHHKTYGNPLYATTFLEGLERDELLTFDLLSVQWTWNLEEIRAKTVVAENVAEFVLRRIEDLDSSVRQLLQLFACLGFMADLDLLQAFYESDLNVEDRINGFCRLDRRRAGGESKETDRTTFEEALALAVEENLVERTGPSCRFSHDRIRSSVYESLPERARGRLHFEIGTFICRFDRDRFVFLAADQINRGLNCISDDTDRLALIQLNLEASQAARKRSGVVLVAEFLRKALELVIDSDWDLWYDLVLDLHCTLAETEATRGNFQEAERLIQTVLKKAKHPRDTARALASRAQIESSRLDFHAAISDTRTALRLLGVHLPHSNPVSMLVELRKMKGLLKGLSDEELLNLRPMEDSTKETAMRILLDCSVYGWTVDPILYVLGSLGMMKLSLLYGMCSKTHQAFASYAQVLAFLGKEPEAFRFAKLALKLMSVASEFTPSTTLFVYCFVIHIKVPCALSIEPTLGAYRAAIENGDMLFGSINIAAYSDLYKFCGLPLDPFASDMRLFAGQLKLFQQTFQLIMMLPNYQLALNLTGQSKDCLAISWDVIKAHGFFSENDVVLENNDKANLVVDYNQIFNAYVLGDLEVAREALDRVLARKKRLRRFEGSHFLNYMFSFLDGLVGQELYNVTQKWRYRTVANEALRWLTKKNTVDTFPLRRLLEAQRAAKGNHEKDAIRKHYQEAIALLLRAGFTHYGAIANEQIGMIMLSLDDRDWAYHYLQHALNLYKEWGARVKVRQMTERYSFLNDSDAKLSEVSSSNIRGRARFNLLLDSKSSSDFMPP